MKLLIEFRDDDRPLEKREAEALTEELRAVLPPGAAVTLRERRPGFGELGSLAHLWQTALDFASGPHAVAVGGAAAVASALRPIFRILEKRQERKIVFKGPGFELQGPASMFSDRIDELMDRVKDATERGSLTKNAAVKKTAAKKTVVKSVAAKKSPVRGKKKK